MSTLRDLSSFEIRSFFRNFEFVLIRVNLGDGEEGLSAYVEPFVILLILFINGCVAIWQDSNADSALEALMDMQAPEAKVLRNSKWTTIDAKELVPGDVVSVRVGDCIPADLRVADIQSLSLSTDQASLTGESVAVQKV